MGCDHQSVAHGAAEVGLHECQDGVQGSSSAATWTGASADVVAALLGTLLLSPSLQGQHGFGEGDAKCVVTQEHAYLIPC